MKTLLPGARRKGELPSGSLHAFGGFTLTELLVVIAVIAIMAAMLVPALSKARHQIVAAACLGNQKQLAAAFQMYAQDNSERIVQMADYDTGDIIYPAGGFWGGPTPEAGWKSAAEAQAAAEAGLSSSNAFFFYCGNVRIYHCPGDLRQLLLPNPRHPDGWGYDSYSRTQNLGGEPYDNYWGAGATYTKMPAITLPGATFSMIDAADWRGFNVGTWVVRWRDDDGFDWRAPPAIWHDKISSIGFADGHAELHKWADPQVVSEGSGAAQGHAISDWEGPLDGPDYAYVYRGYQFPGHSR
jgi:prepilin-type N-terminal cleavage/methylation domain-containing protein